MTSGGAAGLPDAYQTWQARLAAEFFNSREKQPVVMFVDRAVLQDLADVGEDGPRSLAGAVRQFVDVTAGRSMFARIERVEATWRRGLQDEPPPTLPILALSVLAASEMSRDGAIASNNYYIPLAKAMLPDGSEADVAALRTALRDQGAFTAVAEMWVRLDRWLDENGGKFGLSTIREHPELTRIGYPLSQTLVRKSDRAALTRFFDKLNLGSEGIPSQSSLISMLRVWTSTRAQGLSGRFIASLSEPTVGDYMRTVVHQLAVAWDGKIITAEGLRRLDLRLVVDIDRSAAWWVIPAVSDVTEDLLEGLSGGEEFTALLTTDPYSSMFEVDGLPPVSTAALTVGLAARGKYCVAEFQPSKLFVLEDNADAGGWMSVDALQPYEEHVLLVASETVPAVQRVLNDAADSGWQRMAQSIVDGIFSGYAILYGVTFSDQTSLEKAMAVLPVTVAANLRVGANIRPRLVNGLPILRSIGRNIYFPGGEPDLALPVGAEPRKTDVSIDGTTDSLLASIFPFPISRIGPWPEGTHVVRADGEELTFVVASGHADDRNPTGIGRLGWSNGRLGDLPLPQSICGSLCADRAHERNAVLARRGASENWLILPSGQLDEMKEPPPPAGFDGLSFPMFEVDQPKATWLAQKRRDRWSVIRIRVQQPNFRGLSPRDSEVWRELCQVVVADDPIWQMYRTAWERFDGR
ncbi:hypothetical protein [Mycolicibacterium pyrenivorans]|uniref:hypothetical protein n=1 Tax=Mycolicibacterium pyrenivorans TaxID=187102 RepID=UPI0021F29DF8|nr:hypothetical protein [Mycolicibacterium pyrenivorans]MCV7155022.1 hypothetical protein [Mycolicibacterium pyrenivorans]